MQVVTRGAAPVIDTVDTLILDLLEWLDPDPPPVRRGARVVGTLCPRVPGASQDAPGRGALVSVSATGAAHVRKHRQP